MLTQILFTKDSRNEVWLRSWVEQPPDKDIAGPLKDRYDDMITKADATILSFTTGVKLVKAAIVPRLFFTEIFNKKHIGHTDGDEIVQPSHGI